MIHGKDMLHSSLQFSTLRTYCIGILFFNFVSFAILISVMNIQHKKLVDSFQEANQLAISIIPDALNPGREYLCFPLDVDNAYPTRSICKIMPREFIPPSEM